MADTKTLSAEAQAAKQQILSTFPDSNADLLTETRRVSASAMIAKGWSNAGTGYCTYFSNSNGFQDADGVVYEFLWTPIQDNGTILTQSQVTTYLNNLQTQAVNGNGSIMSLDKVGNKIIIARYTTMEEAEEKAELLHEWGAIYYDDLYTASQDSNTSQGTDTETKVGTYYANEPIIQEVAMGVAPGGYNSVSMAQACVKVGNYEFKAEAGWGEEIPFDISTAFRAELAKQTMNYDTTDAQSVIMSVRTGVQYLADGDVVGPNYGAAVLITAYRGGRTESERYFGTVSDTPNDTPKSMKPVGTANGRNWETVNKDDTVMCGSASLSAETEGHKYTSTGGNAVTCRHIYVEDNPLRRQFRFENHLGFIESASCMMRDSKSYKITSENRNMTYAPSYSVKAGLFAKKNGGRAIWKMSSGYVEREWAEWFTTEFLMSPRHWMYINNTWLPVTVTPDSDSTTIYDESKGEITAVNFTVTSTVKGKI